MFDFLLFIYSFRYYVLSIYFYMGCSALYYSTYKWGELPGTTTSPELKVGSCPNNDNSVQIFFCPFLGSIQIILFFESVAAEKTARICREFTFIVCLFLLCLNSDFKNSFVTCPWVCDLLMSFSINDFFLLSWALLEVQACWMGKYYPKMQCSMTTDALSIFGTKPKIALTGVRSRVRESLAKWLI